MPRYIDADELPNIYTATHQELVLALEDAKTADVVERKKGKWYDVGSLSCRCSNCGCKSQKEYSFCPNCGAQMDGVKAEYGDGEIHCGMEEEE